MSDDEIPSDWLTKKQAADRIKRSPSYIAQQAQKEKLHPKTKMVDGVQTNFYDPHEVDALLVESPSRALAVSNEQAYQTIALETVRASLDLIRLPREKVDALLLATIERQEKRIIDLEQKLDAQREATEKAKDATADRELAAKMATTEMDIKKVAAGRMIDTCGKLVTWWMTAKTQGGTNFTPEQWEELLLANNDGESKFLTAEQEEQGKKIVAEHKAKTNGKKVVESVVETAKTVVETQGAST